MVVCGADEVGIEKQRLTWQVAYCVVCTGMTQLTLVVNVASALSHVRVTGVIVTNWPRGTALGCTAVFGS